MFSLRPRWPPCECATTHVGITVLPVASTTLAVHGISTSAALATFVMRPFSISTTALSSVGPVTVISLPALTARMSWEAAGSASSTATATTRDGWFIGE
jgi:hypothetical protein